MEWQQGLALRQSNKETPKRLQIVRMKTSSY
jgi:hypothetical protein